MATEQIDGIEFYVDVDTAGAVSSTKVIDNTTKKIESSFKGVDTQVTKSSKAVKKGLTGVGRGAGQAGIQFQQFIGQVQGGQSAMLALSQQSADLGIVLGAPLVGAVVGIAASLVGILAPALLKTIEATKDFKFNVEDAAKELKNLNDLSKAQVSVAIGNTGKSMDALAKAAGVAGNRIAAVNQQLDAGVKTSVRITKTGRAVIETTKLTAKGTKELEKELAQEQATLDKINQEYKRQSDLLVKLSKNKDGFSKESDKQADSNKNLSESLNAQIIALEQGEEAAFRYATAQQLGLKVGEQIPANIDEQISAIFRLKQAQKDVAAQKRKDAADERKLSSLGSSTANLGLTDEEQVRERLARDLELLNQAQEAKIESEKSYEDRRVELRRQAEERIRAINAKTTEESIVNYEALENQVVGTFASVVSGAQDGKQAVRSLAQSVITQMIGALIKMGIQAAIGQTTAAATGAATAATLSAAYATPAALASLASFGANAAPAAAGIASTVGLAQGLSLAGGREAGGLVGSGKLYEVGEKNKPELLQSGSKQYMIPGNNGRVISNDDIGKGGGSGGSQINVTVNTLPGQSANVSQQGEGVNRSMVIDIINEQASSVGTEMTRGLKGSLNATYRQAGKRRNN